jgi:hypothetical protein
MNPAKSQGAKARPAKPPVEFEAFVRAAMATGKPPKVKPKKRKVKK